jgi:hypothetical protein
MRRMGRIIRGQQLNGKSGRSEEAETYTLHGRQEELRAAVSSNIGDTPARVATECPAGDGSNERL